MTRQKTVQEMKVAFRAAQEMMDDRDYLVIKTGKWDANCHFLSIEMSTSNGKSIQFKLEGKRISSADLQEIIG
jgi:hypothetical protein